MCHQQNVLTSSTVFQNLCQAAFEALFHNCKAFPLIWTCMDVANMPALNHFPVHLPSLRVLSAFQHPTIWLS